MKVKLDIKKLQKKFNSFRETYNMRGFADCMIEVFQLHEAFLKNNMRVPHEFMDFYKHIDAYSYVMLMELSKHNGTQAMKYIDAILRISPDLPNKMFHLYFIIAIANYEVGNFQKAEENWKIYLIFRQQRWQDSDEIALFYLGNTFAYEHNFQMAKAAYEQCLNMKKSFYEAADNIIVINEIISTGQIDSLNKLHRYIEKSLLDIDENDEAVCFNIPIFINARDRVGVMKQQVDWLLNAGYNNLIILDNKSSYPPLLEYYRTFINDDRVKTVALGQNLGFKAIWKSNILEFLDIRTPYVYTDPDLVPIDSCPKNFVQKLLKILKQNPLIKKVGLGMVYDDITFYDKDYWQDIESHYYDFTDVAKDLFYIQVDTTLALYVNCRHYNLRFSMRTLGDMMARHLPWYFDYNNLPEDEQYYLDHADKSSSIGSKLREDKPQNS